MQAPLPSIKVFLSYSHANMDEKEEIKRALKASKKTVYFLLVKKLGVHKTFCDTP